MDDHVVIKSALGAATIYLLGSSKTIAVQSAIGSLAIYWIAKDNLNWKKLGTDKFYYLFEIGRFARSLGYIGAMAINGQIEQMNPVIAGAAFAIPQFIVKISDF